MPQREAVPELADELLCDVVVTPHVNNFQYSKTRNLMHLTRAQPTPKPGQALPRNSVTAELRAWGITATNMNEPN